MWRKIYYRVYEQIVAFFKSIHRQISVGSFMMKTAVSHLKPAAEPVYPVLAGSAANTNCLLQDREGFAAES